MVPFDTMRMTDEERQQMILKVLSPRTEGQAGSGAIAARTLWSWERVAFQLTPLIGEAGFRSLYARAVHLVIPNCPRLTPARQSQPLEALLQKLKQDLEILDSAEAVRTSNLLLATFTELLSTLIGESLTSRVLHSAWTDESGNIIGKDIGND